MSKKENQQLPESGPELPQKPVKKKDDGILLPILYALLASVGLSILVMAVGIGVTASGNAAQAEAQTTTRGTLPATPYIAPTTPPKSTPTAEQEKPADTQELAQETPGIPTQAAAVQTQAPAQTQTPAPTKTPATTQTNPPAVQPTTNVNPVVPTAAPTQPPADTQTENGRYVLNTNTMKFHTPSCRDVPRIDPENRQESNQTRDQIIGMGYSPCGHCSP